MPVSSKEIGLHFPFSRNGAVGRRVSVVSLRYPDHAVGLITPNYYMVPVGLTGCEIGPVFPPEPDADHLIMCEGNVVVAPPLVKDERFQYSVSFLCRFDPKGAIEWHIKHPTELISMHFYPHSDCLLPPCWQALLTSLRESSGVLEWLPVDVGMDKVQITANRPSLGSKLIISWGQEPLDK